MAKWLVTIYQQIATVIVTTACIAVIFYCSIVFTRWHSSNKWFCGYTRVHIPTIILSGSTSDSLCRDRNPDKHADRQTMQSCSNGPHLADYRQHQCWWCRLKTFYSVIKKIVWMNIIVNCVVFLILLFSNIFTALS